MAENLTPEQAFDVLSSQVHAPVFFEKLARVYGVRPQTDEDARELLSIAATLRGAYEQDQVKQAQAANGMLKQAHASLKSVLAEQGYNVAREADAPGLAKLTDVQVKTAADNVIATNAQVKEAAIVYQQFLANRK